MSSIGRPYPIPFLVTAETPCPYLPERMERKIITELSGPSARQFFELLSRAGFRRSHAIAYRPACTNCRACMPVRIPVADFRPSRTQKRIFKRLSPLRARQCDSIATEEQYVLFSRYLAARHADGEMVSMGQQDFSSMVADSPVDTRMIEFRNESDELIAACLSDWGADGISAVYSFFDPTRAKESLGIYVILWLIEAAKARGLDYVYLGYLVLESKKMSYKSRFYPLETHTHEGWKRQNYNDIKH